MSETEVKTEDKRKGRDYNDDDFDPWAAIWALLHEVHLTREPYQYEVDEARRAHEDGQSAAEYRRQWHRMRETALRDIREAAASKPPPKQTQKPAPKQRTDPDPDDDPDDPDDGSDDGSSGGNGPSAGRSV